MTPHFTDTHRYPRGYVRSEATDVAKTWAAARKKLEPNRKPPSGGVRVLKQVA